MFRLGRPAEAPAAEPRPAAALPRLLHGARLGGGGVLLQQAAGEEDEVEDELRGCAVEGLVRWPLEWGASWGDRRAKWKWGRGGLTEQGEQRQCMWVCWKLGISGRT